MYYQALDPELAVNCAYLTFIKYVFEDTLLRESMCIVKKQERTRVLNF